MPSPAFFAKSIQPSHPHPIQFKQEAGTAADLSAAGKDQGVHLSAILRRDQKTNSHSYPHDNTAVHFNNLTSNTLHGL